MKMIVQNLAVEYSDAGTGPCILMLHGWKDTLHSFDALVGELSDTFRIVRLDMPGFGASDMPDPSWRLDDYVDFVEACIEKLHLDVAVFLGHSFGGRVVVKGVSRGVFHPQKIVLIASAGVSERNIGRSTTLGLLAKAGKLVTAPLPGTVRSTLRRHLYERIGSDYHASGRLKDIFLNVVGENLSQAASAIRVPTLLIWGADDQQTPLSDGQKFARIIAGSKLETIPAATHFVHQEHPGRVATLIANFV